MQGELQSRIEEHNLIKNQLQGKIEENRHLQSRVLALQSEVKELHMTKTIGSFSSLDLIHDSESRFSNLLELELEIEIPSVSNLSPLAN